MKAARVGNNLKFAPMGLNPPRHTTVLVPEPAAVAGGAAEMLPHGPMAGAARAGSRATLLTWLADEARITVSGRDEAPRVHAVGWVWKRAEAGRERRRSPAGDPPGSHPVCL